MVDGWFLFVKGKVQMKQFRGADELEFKVVRIELLSDILEKLAGRLRIQLAVDRLTEEKATEICDLLQNHSGGVGVTVELHHEENVLDMISRKQKVELSPELLDTLDGLDGVAY